MIPHKKLCSSLKERCPYLPALSIGPSWVSINIFPEPSKLRKLISLGSSLVSLCTAPVTVTSTTLTFSVALYNLLSCPPKTTRRSLQNKIYFRKTSSVHCVWCCAVAESRNPILSICYVCIIFNMLVMLRFPLRPKEIHFFLINR